MGKKSIKAYANSNGFAKKAVTNGYPRNSIPETISNGFFTVDNKWIVKYWNKAAEKLLGLQAKDIIGKNIWEKFAGVIPVNFYTNYHKAFLQNTPHHFEEYWGEMGSWFDVITYYCNDTLSVSFKSSNQPDQPALRLKALNELYRLVTEVTNDCLWEWNLQFGEIFWIDGGHKRVFGYQVENALISQSFWESCLHPDDKVPVLTKLNKIIAEETESVWEAEYRFKRADGSYANVHDKGHIIYNEDKKPVRMIGATQDISERVLLEIRLDQERLTRQKEITDAVLTAQENEREEIGRELHDNINQILAVAKLYIQMANTDKKKRKIYAKKASGFLVNGMEEIRKISKKLVIPGIDGIGLTDRIENILDDLSDIHPIEIEFHKYDIDEKDLDKKLQLTIFRIVQEQLNNILKHSKATQAAITLSRYENEITLLISDNGKGCDISKKNGVGIINIKSRAFLFDGRVTIVSKPGKGYELKVVLPLKAELNKLLLSKAITE
ncbi:MAG TPA: PAS domain-containing protein [Chitinophagaceae bacterium]|nr:PAS domain-containing protein [Chitinophagaceae bacterium]